MILVHELTLTLVLTSFISRTLVSTTPIIAPTLQMKNCTPLTVRLFRLDKIMISFRSYTNQVHTRKKIGKRIKEHARMSGPILDHILPMGKCISFRNFAPLAALRLTCNLVLKFSTFGRVNTHTKLTKVILIRL